jgi:hypothetical protein
VTVPVLYHYTCEHGARGIRTSGGVLVPGLDRLVWLTDLDTPVRDALGLWSFVTPCDRTAYRFEVAEDNGYTWPWVGPGRWAMDPAYVELLEAAPGVMPRHWWVSGREVRASESVR